MDEEQIQYNVISFKRLNKVDEDIETEIDYNSIGKSINLNLINTYKRRKIYKTQHIRHT